MPLDVFSSGRPPDVPIGADFSLVEPSFGESFGAAMSATAGTIRDFRVQNNQFDHVQNWISEFQKGAGYAPDNPEYSILAGNRAVGYEALRKAYDAEKLKRPDLALAPPPTEADARGAAIDLERKREETAASVAARPGSWLGTTLGGMAGVATDPINLASMAVGVPEAAGILSTALRIGAIAGVSQAGISAASFGVNREIDPNYGVSQAALEVGSASVGGAVLGGGLKGLALAWARLTGRPRLAPVPEPRPAPEPAGGAPSAPETAVPPPEPAQLDLIPRDVRDAGNIVTREAAVTDASPYKSAGLDGELAHARNYAEAEKAITEGRAPEIPQDQFATGTWRPGKVFTSGGHEVGVRYEVVEADSLVASQRADLSPNPDYPADLQPRDRTRAASTEQIAEIAAKLNPELLGVSKEAATGAPVVGPDNVIESGNGRWLALKRVYGSEGIDGAALKVGDKIVRGHTHIDALDRAAKQLGMTPEEVAARVGTGDDNYIALDGFVTTDGRFVDRAEAGRISDTSSRANAYRDYLRAKGFNTTGFREPVLIARRTTPMSDSERISFASAANRATTLRMSAPEQAAADARLLDGPVIAKLAEGGIDHADNRPFVKSFFAKLPQAERGGLIDRHGVLSAEGIRRVEAALLARAYGDPTLLSRILESPDSNIKALAGALTDTAGGWSTMRDAVSRGTVPAGMDITNDLLDAMRLVAKARDEKVKLTTLVDQAEMFAAPSPITRALLQLMFRDEALTKAASRASVARGLKAYADEAIKNTTDARLFDEPLSAGDVLTASLAKAGRDDLAPAAEQAVLPLTARETLAKPEVDDAVLHQLEHLQEQSPEPIMVPHPEGTLNADGSPVMVSVKALVEEADREIAAAKEIADCAVGKMTPAAA